MQLSSNATSQAELVDDIVTLILQRAAQSLVLMLTNLDYSTFETVRAAHLTNSIHILINEIEGLMPLASISRNPAYDGPMGVFEGYGDGEVSE